MSLNNVSMIYISDLQFQISNPNRRLPTSPFDEVPPLNEVFPR
jgi:hypothetical protein